MTPDRIFEKKKILICCGSGGVGKTTVSAAIALEAARRGKKAIVLTIDPAKRLASAMGLEELGNEPIEIDFHSRVNGGGGRLFAMMLDTKRTFDRIVEKYASSLESRRAILSNPLYQQLSNMIAGSQEYMAMERLYELHEEGHYELLVLDTPPTRHALDFLDAPQKMIDLTRNSLLKWFLKPGLFFTKQAEKIFSVFDRLAGFGFLKELAEMISLMGGFLGGFHDRAEAVGNLLRRQSVGFLLVTSPSSFSIQDALYFYRKIQESDLPFLGFVVNRIHRARNGNLENDLLRLSASLREKVLVQLRNQEQLALRDEKGISLLKKMGGKNVFLAKIPLFSDDVHDLEGLSRLNEALFG